jgi:isopentenyl-diphosphate delta-isomerase type 1
MPSDEALAHSAQLTQKIIERIQQKNNWISFEDYMHMALYEPGLGYYTAGAHKLGREGDFVTAPMISPLFSQCLAQFCMNNSAIENILELGAGTGVMAKDILLFLEKNNQLPERYYILEVSADLRQRQQIFLKQEIPHLYAHIQWLDTLPENFIGIILANEVLDAMPVHLFHYKDNEIFETGVTLEKNNFTFKDKIADAKLQEQVNSLPIENKMDYLSEINLNLSGFLNSLSAALQEGLIVFIDYGFDEHTYYHPHRLQGTLMCHYRHHSHTDPFFYPGLQDITAHVDFTALANAGIAAGLEVEYFANQAMFLLENGLIELANTPDMASAQQINTLSSPAEMGELFKIMALSKKNTPLKTVLLVDEHNQIIGEEEVMRAHQLGLRHRAFSIFIIQLTDSGPLVLLQQRHLDKYHSGGLWTNTCCSHAKPDQSLLLSGEQRLMEEMGIAASLTEIGIFEYQSNVGNGLIEHEIDHVMMGFTDTHEVKPSPIEAMDYRWLTLTQVAHWLEQEPEVFTVWFKPAFEILLNYLNRTNAQHEYL